MPDLVVFDFGDTICRVSNVPDEDFLPGNPHRIYLWNITDAAIISEAHPAIVSLIKDWQKAKATVVLITKRPAKARRYIEARLKKVGITFDQMHLGVRDKHKLILQIAKQVKAKRVAVYENEQKMLDRIGQAVVAGNLVYEPHLINLDQMPIPKAAKAKAPTDAEPAKPLNPIQSAHKLLHRLDLLGVEDVIVGYSGGKDSLATLDVCVQHFGAQHVKAFFLYTLPDLECESALADFPTKRYGIEVLKLPLPSMMDMIRNGFGRYTSPSLQQLLDRKYTWNEVEKIARNKLKARWICYGHRMQDSLQRRGMLTRCNGVWETAYKTGKLIQRAYPLWQWNHKMVFSYLETHRLPIPHMFGAGDINTSGLSLVDPDILLYVKEHYPNDFRRLKRVFPQLETPIFRQEVLQRSFAQMEESPTEKQETSPITLQQTSELFETEVAKILKLQKTRNNFAVDWIGVDADGNEIGIELKVLNKAEDNQSRVQMRPSARKRKLAWIAADPLHRKGCTILIDNRDNYAGGAYQQFYSGHRIYWAGDFGAFRIDSMTKVSSLSHLVQKLWPKSSPDLGDVNRKFAELMERTYGNRG